MAQTRSTELVQFPFRLRRELRARLKKAAARAKVSVNSEIISRLETSFQLDDGDPRVRNVVMTMAGLIKAVEARTGKSCHDDKETFRQLQMVFAGFLGLPFQQDDQWRAVHDELVDEAMASMKGDDQ